MSSSFVRASTSLMSQQTRIATSRAATSGVVTIGDVLIGMMTGVSMTATVATGVCEVLTFESG